VSFVHACFSPQNRLKKSAVSNFPRYKTDFPRFSLNITIFSVQIRNKLTDLHEVIDRAVAAKGLHNSVLDRDFQNDSFARRRSVGSSGSCRLTLNRRKSLIGVTGPSGASSSNLHQIRFEVGSLTVAQDTAGDSLAVIATQSTQRRSLEISSQPMFTAEIGF
jgi:hypothetical protein